jgi:hypothetical protein
MLGLSEVWERFGRSPVDILERNGGVTHIDGAFYRVEPVEGENLFRVQLVREVDHVFAREGGDNMRGDWGYCSQCGRPMYVCKFCGEEHTETYTTAGEHEAATTPVCSCEQAQQNLCQLQWRPDLAVGEDNWIAVWYDDTGMRWVGGYEQPLLARRQAIMKMAEAKVA